VAFIVFAIAVIAWSLAVLRWAISLRRARGRRAMVMTSCAVVVVGAASIALDVHAMWIVRSAPSSDLEIRILQHGDWWQLEYSRNRVRVTTANEMHLPAGERFTLNHSVVVATGASNLLGSSDRNVRNTPPIIVQSREDFDRWFANEARPANVSLAAASRFREDGCAYCHVIRGVVNETWRVAPDLTHFASRATIAASGLPNRRGQLTGWVVHSRGVKPKSEMPDNAMRPDELHAVVALLESLH
jgi:cytochrome c oxidase subunit 2